MLAPVLNNWNGWLDPPWLQAAVALAAALCGALIGSERERHEKPAGLRTMMLVCLGSATFTMVSFVFTSTAGDSGRVAAQVVTGIGFLGAGVILHSRGNVTGATTAATIWVTAAIGLVVGVGHIVAGVALSLLVRVVLVGVRLFEHRVLGGTSLCVVELVCDADHGKTRARLERILDEFHVNLPWEEQAGSDDQTCRLSLELRLPRHRRCELLSEIASLAAVKQIRQSLAPAAP